jgi:hypothetical protein
MVANTTRCQNMAVKGPTWICPQEPGTLFTLHFLRTYEWANRASVCPWQAFSALCYATLTGPSYKQNDRVANTPPEVQIIKLLRTNA